MCSYITFCPTLRTTIVTIGHTAAHLDQTACQTFCFSTTTCNQMCVIWFKIRIKYEKLSPWSIWKVFVRNCVWLAKDCCRAATKAAFPTIPLEINKSGFWFNRILDSSTFYHGNECFYWSKDPSCPSHKMKEIQYIIFLYWLICMYVLYT